MSKFDFKKGIKDLGNGVYAYVQPDGTWGWSNAGLIVDEGEALLVDTLYDMSLTNEMLKAFKETVPNLGSIDTIVNTHDNGDHWFGNAAVNAKEIITTTLSAKNMAGYTPDDMLRDMTSKEFPPEVHKYLQDNFGMFDYNNITPALPTRTFDGRLDLMVGSKKVELIEVGPAHTDGDLIVHVPHARTVFAADMLFIGGHQTMWVGPVANFIKAIDLMISFDPEYIVPGHGPVVTQAQALEIKEYWEYYRDEAKIRYDKGMESFTAAKDIPLGKYADYTNPDRIALNLDVLYREFSNTKEPCSQAKEFVNMARY